MTMKQWIFHISMLLQLIVLYVTYIISEGTTDCQVQVSEPWPPLYLFVPENSRIEMNCTALDKAKSPIWSIDLASVPGRFQFRFDSQSSDHLNADGVFEILTPEMPSIRRLVINNTAVNNQTTIFCQRSLSLGTLSTITLFVFTPTLTSLEVLDNDVNSIKLMWSQKSLLVSDEALAFSLTISNGSSSHIVPQLNESYYYFTAPEGASPCELYNFSVTATYVGATYTGAGCSVPSPMLSTVLPSLPNISPLDSSLGYVLTKQTTGFALYISFEPASYCNDYPIMNYTLEINGTQNDEIRVSVFAPNAENFTIGDNLSENVAYSFRIQVANTVGVVSTSDRQFYTTDVQVVTATLIKGVNTSIIGCEFIEDSNAAGCQIVLTTNNGEQDYYNLTKNQNTNSTAIAVTLELPPSCYSGVKAFDIESDGSVGTLAIPGHIMNLSQVQCTPATLPVKPSSSGTLWEAWIIALVVVISAVVSILSAVIIVIVCVCKSKKSHRRVLNIAIDAPTNTSFKTRCPSMSQCSADETAQVELRERADSRNESIDEEHLPDQPEHCPGKSITSGKGEMEATCNDMPINCQPDESATSVNFYSEIVSISKPRENATPRGGSGKSENVYSEPGCKQPPTKREKTRLPLEEALYDQPVAGLERTPGDGADYSRTSYCQQASPVPVNVPSTANSEGAQYAKLDQNMDHIYFMLEPSEPPCGVIPSPTSHLIPFIPNTQVPPPPATTSASPPPIYQEISELSTSRGGSANRSVTCTANGGSIPNTPLSSSSLPHVQRSLSAPMADQGVTDTSNQWVKINNISVERGTMV